MRDRDPLEVDVTVRDPDCGETIHHTITHYPHQAERKEKRAAIMLDTARERALRTLTDRYDDGGESDGRP